MPRARKYSPELIERGVRLALESGRPISHVADDLGIERNDRVWRSRGQLELAIVEYISWFNDSRLHESLDDRTPQEIEELYAAKSRPTTTTS
jgi:transposase InsO family protein